eukprot:c28660_g1_i5 orf=690-1910(+)
MAFTWTGVGDAANVAQLTGLDAVNIISLIVKTAKNARMHKKNCRQFAQHLKLIGNLLAQLKLSELKKRPETNEPLEELEDALKKAYLLVNSCQSRSYLYLIAFGWSIVNQFKETQGQIDRLLRLIPLITLVENNRDRLQAIEKDKREYTMDEEEKVVQDTILKSEPTKLDSSVLQKSLSRSYPGLPFNEALQKEKEKLHIELNHMQDSMEFDHVDVIRHLIFITESANDLPLQSKNLKYTESECDGLRLADEGHKQQVGEDSPVSQQSVQQSTGEECNNYDSTCYNHDTSYHIDQETQSNINSSSFQTWHNHLYDFYKDPYLSQEAACNNYVFFSLFLACYCYTCCVRRKLRKRFGIPGGSCDDFWAHALCFSCALIQEWHEIIAQEGQNSRAWRMNVPQVQTMDR